MILIVILAIFATTTPGGSSTDFKYGLNSGQDRKRRDIADVQYLVECGASSSVTEGVLLFDVDYHGLTDEQKTQFVTMTSSYVSVQRRNVLVVDNHGRFYKTELANPKFLSFGLGDTTDAQDNTTVVKFLVSCGTLSASDSRISLIKTESQNGELRKRFGHPLISWYFISGTFVPLTTTSLPMTTTPPGPQPPQITGPVSISVENTTFFLEYTIPDNVFYDREDGGSSNLSLHLFQSNGLELEKTSWIMLSQNKLMLFSTNAIYHAQPNDGYSYRLSAMDSSGLEAHTDLKIKFIGPLFAPNYVRRIVVTSTSSVVVISYLDVYVLKLLQLKMSPYLGIPIGDLFNVEFNVTRSGTSMLSVTYTFSTRNLVQHSCNTSAINGLRSKLEGSVAVSAFRAALQPQFQLSSVVGEMFESSCSSVSAEKPSIGVLIGTIEISIGRYFSFSISTSAFTSPMGTTMRLKLELRFENNTAIPPNYWISLSSSYLDEKPSLKGILMSKMANSISSMSIKMVAITPLLQEASQTVQLNIQPMSMKVLFFVVMTQNSPISISLASFVSPFISFMSTFLGISSSSFIIINFSVSFQTSIAFTITSLSAEPCPSSQIQALKEKLIDSNGNVNENLKTGLASTVNFSPNQVDVKLTGSCDPPSVAFQIPELTVPKYDSLIYQVPVNAFRDETDSSNLNVQLLQSSGNALQETSWIWYDNVTRTISGFPFDVTSGAHVYILRATDSDGQFADQNISVKLNWQQPSYNFFYQVKFSYNPNLLPYSNIITKFIQSVKLYFNQPNAMDIVVFRPLFLYNSKISLYFQNTSLNSAGCDVIGNNYILSRIRDGLDKTKPNLDFVSFMQPNFNLEQVDAGESPSCSIANRKPPYFNSGDSSINNYYSIIKAVPYCSVKSYLIPANTFIDEEEGNTRNLKLRFTDEAGKPLPIDSWVAMNATSQTLYAVATDDIFSSSRSLPYQYKLVATDSDGKSTSATVNFNVDGPPPAGYYNITMSFNVSLVQNEPYVFQLNSILSRLQEVLADGPGIHVHSYSVERILGDNHIATLIWSICQAENKTCDNARIEHIRSKLFTSGTTNMNPNLRVFFNRNFIITDVKESRSGPCSVEPPYVHSPVPDLKVTFCGPFSYDIPANVFQDKQDGDTRKLQVNLFQHNGVPVARDFWLQFDSVKQRITAVLTAEQNLTSYQRDHIFLLEATDSSNLKVNTTLRVSIVGFMPSYSHSFTIDTVYSIPAIGNALYEFAYKMSSFLGQNFQVIHLSEATESHLIVSWTNCSLRYEPCDVISINAMRDKMQKADGSVTEAFKTAMEPEFSRIFLKETKFRPCERDLPPVLAVPVGPITVTTCETYRMKIPEGTFTDEEQGSTRSLNLKMKDNPYYWIHFDSVNQELAIVLTNEISKKIPTGSIIITITATDLFQQVAQQDITVRFNRKETSPNHKVSMHFFLSSISEKREFVGVYDDLRKKIVEYFSGSSLLSSVEFGSLQQHVTSNASLKAEWSSCSIPQNECDKSLITSLTAMVSSNNAPTTAFKQALMPTFTVYSINTTFEGLCKDEISKPIVQNPLPIIDINFCGYTVYQIPANTFYDKLDGDTRNLTLSILNSSDQVATESWFHFDSVQQTLRVLLSSDNFANIITPAIFTYKLKAMTKRGISAVDKLQFRLTGPQPNVSYSLKLNFLWQQLNPPNKLAILTTVMDRLSSYLGRGPEDVYIISRASSAMSIGEYFSINTANCSASYDPCDRGALEMLVERVHGKEGVVESFRQSMGANVRITYVQVKTLGPCNILNTAPQVKIPLPKLQVQTCSDFNYTIPKETFFDEEQSKLHLSVTKVNGIPVSGSYEWVSIDSATSVLYGVISDTVLINKPSNGYNLTIRATDNSMLFVETFLILDIVGSMPQKLYQFTMTLQPTASMPSLFSNQVYVTRLLNGYFNAKFAHLINVVSNTGTVIVRCSICPLPKKCDEALAYSYFRKITTDENTVPAEIAAYFAHQYTITGTSLYRNPLCKAAINPPVPSRSAWSIVASYCGGFRITVPEDLFSDKEDGNTRNLQLSLRHNATHTVQNDYWVQLDAVNQELYGFPTRAITLAAPTVLLFAKDSTGQEASVTIVFTFTAHPEPKYIYKIVYQKVSVIKLIDDVESFSSKIRSFLNDDKNTSFGLIRHSHSLNSAYQIDFANCSVTYDPCDIHALTSVKNRLFNVDNLPTTAFKNAMFPIIISYGVVQVLEPCLGTLSNPPRVVIGMTTLNIPVWSIFTYQIPPNTFYDTEDGSTRRLVLDLTGEKNSVINSDSWIQFNSTTQAITALGYASVALLQPSLGFSFTLTATDSSKLSAADNFHVKIYGPAQIMKDCQIQMVFDTHTTNSDNVQLASTVIASLAKYLSLKSDSIGLVEFTRNTPTKFTFSWSYVSPTYHVMSPTAGIADVDVDYKGLVSAVLTKLFQADRKTIFPSLSSAFSVASLVSAKTAFSGVCHNIPPVTMLPSSLSITVPYAGYRKEAIQKGWFYDYEDGNAEDLKLQLLSGDNKTVGISSWANIDLQSKSLLFSLRDLQRYSSQKAYKFNLIATDSGGKTAVLQIDVTTLESSVTLSPFNVTLEFTLVSSWNTEVYVNQSIMATDRIGQLYSLGDGRNVITNQFNSQDAPVSTRSLTWQPDSYESCSSSNVLKKTRDVLQPNSVTFTQFKSFFLPELNLQRIHYLSSCGYPGMAPSPSPNVLEFNITLCSPFIYKLPANTFVDSADGEMPNMRVRFIGKDKKDLPTNSWISLNSGTLQLYAIYQSSMLQSNIASSATASSSMSSESGIQSFEFNLEVTNSRGLKSYKPVKINVLDYPYTSDCYAKLNIVRTFGPTHVQDLDVLYKLIASISQYYNDPTVKLKVHNFTRQSDFQYQLIFSNCSFVFSTMKRARQGLDESYRVTISSIFSKMIQDGTIQPAFQSALSLSGFKLQNISVSYSCIEAPPQSIASERVRYAFFLLSFNDVLPSNLFTDVRDGFNLKLSLHYLNGTLVSLNEWLQINQNTRTIYGSVTMMQASTASYRYLLTATDSSYRTASISYIVRIANSPPVQNVRFYLGFTSSIFTKFTTTAYVLRNFTMKIAKYIANNDLGSNIIIYTYKSLSSISWQYTQLQCNPTSVESMMTKLQKDAFKSEPSEAFKTALAPEFTAHSIFIDGPNCTSSTVVQITTTNSQININSSTCGYLVYRISDNLFQSSTGETTKDFLLALQPSTASEIPGSSVVQFYANSREILVVPVLSKISQLLSYRLIARSTRSTSASATTEIQFKFHDFKKTSSSENRLCTMTVNATTNYNPDVPESELLQKFTEKLANYLSVSYQQIQIVSYTRFWSFPTQLSIQFTYCKWASMSQISDEYLQDVNSVTQKLFQGGNASGETANKNFVFSLKPDFDVQSIEKNISTCVEPPNRPPIGRALDQIMAPRCGEFNYRIPIDLFSDEDGNTRKLETNLMQGDGNDLPTDSWIVYNNITQTISGLPTDETLTKQTSMGYQYRVIATDTKGSSSYVLITIKVNGLPYTSTNGPSISLSYMSAISSQSRAELILAFTRKLSSYKVINDPQNRFRVKSVDIRSSNITISLLNCTPCDVEAFAKYFDVSMKQSDLQTHMAPQFPRSYFVKTSGQCSPSDEGYNNVTSGSTQNVTFCARTKLNFLSVNSISALPPDTKFIIRQQNKDTLPMGSWFWLNETVLEAFPSEQAWKEQHQTGTPYLWSTAKRSTGVRTGGFIENILRITGIPPRSGLQYSIDFKSSDSASKADAYFISVIFNALTAYFGREDLQHISFNRQAGDRFKWMFLVCGLPSTCTDANVKSLNSKIYEESGELRPNFKAIFPDFIAINNVNSSCNNNPPKILRKNLTLTIPKCGLFRYKIPRDFARDYEDGDADNLAISLRMPNGDIPPRDSWIQLNETSHEIYSFPPESISTTSNPTGWDFLLSVKDKDGAQATTDLKVFVEPDENPFYKLNFTFETINQEPTIPYLDIQVQFLSMISKFFLFNATLSQYRVLKFEKTSTTGPKSETFSIQFGNCSVAKYVCQSVGAELVLTREKMISSYKDPSSSFSRYITGKYRILSIKNESLYSIDTMPRVLNSMNEIRVEMCSMFVGEIPKSTFYDVEQVEGGKLTTKLTFMNDTGVPNDYWVQKLNEKIYAVPYGDIESGTYQFKLTATDSCGQIANTVVKVVLLGEANYPAIEFNMMVRLQSTTNLPAVYFAYQMKEKIKAGLQNSDYSTKITYFQKTGDVAKLKWINCSSSCDKQSTNAIKSKVYDNKAFKESFLPNSTVLNITDDRSKYCYKGPTSNNSITVQVKLCQKLNLTVPIETIFEGEVSNLKSVMLLDESMNEVSKQDWVQYDAKNRIIYGYPRVPIDGFINRINRYYLLVADRTGNTGITNVTIEIVGDAPNVTQRLTLTGEANMSDETPMVAQEIAIINQIGFFFDDYDINNIQYKRNGSSISYVWSFCKDNTEYCDCNRVRSTRDKLKNINTFKQQFRPNFEITGSVDEELLGACRNENSPLVYEDRMNISVQPGQYFSTSVSDAKFYDYEDGYTRNLTVYLINQESKRLDRSSWITIQDFTICGLITLHKSERMTSTTSVYQTVARDRCGNEAVDFYNVTVLRLMPRLNYKVNVFLNDSFGMNCSLTRIFTQKVSRYIDIPEKDIFIYNYTVYNGTNNATVVTWGLANVTERNCSNNTLRELTDKILFSNGTVNKFFIEYMQPEYQVVDVKDDKSELCLAAPILLPYRSASEDDFPWWLIILLIFLIILLFVLWLLWIIIPRCCWGCCIRKLACCKTCCTPGGKYSSLEEPPFEEGVAGIPKDDKVEIVPHEEVPDDTFETTGINSPLEGVDEEKIDFSVSPHEGPAELETEILPSPSEEKPEFPSKENSSGYSEDFSDDGEEIMEQSTLLMTESAPLTISDIPLTLPTTSVPPLYPYGVDSSQQNSDDFEENRQEYEQSFSYIDENRNDSFSQLDVVANDVNNADDGSTGDEDLPSRKLPQPNIQYSNLRRPSQIRLITSDSYNPAAEFTETETRVFRKASTDDAIISTQSTNNSVDYGQRRISRITSPIRVVEIPNRRFSSTRRYSISNNDLMRSEEAPENQRLRRRRSVISVVNGQIEDDSPIIFRRRSISRRSLSEGDLLSDLEYEPEPYSTGRRTSRQYFVAEDLDGRVSRKLSTSSYIGNDQDGRSLEVVTLPNANSGGPSRRISRKESMQFISTNDTDMTQDEWRGNPFVQESRDRRYSTQISNSRLSENGRRRRSMSSERRFSQDGIKSVYIGERYGESDSGISDYGLYISRQDNDMQRKSARRMSRQDTQERKRRRSVLTPSQRSRRSRVSQYAMEPRRVSRVYVNDAFVSDSVV